MIQFPLLANTVITTALSGVVTLFGELPADTSELLLEAVFTYGSSGTSVAALVETGLDNVTWTQIATFNFTTSSARKIANLFAKTPVTTIYDATTALSSNTVKDGIIGKYVRITLTTVGTYAGNTSIQLNALARG